jgi:cytidylate kinase
MRHILTLEQFLTEGVHDKGILKAFFMAGGPGSGKSYVATEIFDFPKGSISSVSYATGLKLVNNDNAFEKMAKDAGFELDKMSSYQGDEWDKLMDIRNKAKGLTKRQMDNYIYGRLGMVIDGTGKDYKKIAGHRALLNDLGYDTYMVFVNTSLDVALQRNQQRERKLKDEMVEKMWKEVQDNIGRFQGLFGATNMIIIDNSSYDNLGAIDAAEKMIMQKMREEVKNPVGKKWIKEQTTYASKNRPM